MPINQNSLYSTWDYEQKSISVTAMRTMEETAEETVS